MSTNGRDQSTDEGKRPVIVEDKPQMRSVSMMSAPPPIPLRHGAMPPPLKFGAAPPPSLKQAPSLSIYGSKPQQPTETRWRVTTPLVKPSYYEFERTHATIQGVSSVEISKRIDETLRKASIAASFDDKEAVARANTCECLKFAVRLWQADGGVTVEVQRTKGCSFLFQQTVKRILHAAQTGSDKAPKAPPAFRSIPAIPEPEWEKSTVDGVSMVSESLQNQNKTDAHELAIESLVELSKSTNCKAFCSKLVFAEDSMIVDTLVSLILHSKIAPGAEESSNADTAIRRNAVNALANCLEECSEAETTAILARFPSLTSPEVLHALMRDLGCAGPKPHCAAAACRCLSLLCKADETSRSVLQPIRSVLSSSQTDHHEVLRVESNKLLQAL